ncbi:putative ribonuclease H-like domain-containing protein [Tanacetum coccineum]
MQDELLQFNLQKVWRLVDLPKGKHAIGKKWIYRNKKDERGILVRNKARQVQIALIFEVMISSIQGRITPIITELDQLQLLTSGFSCSCVAFINLLVTCLAILASLAILLSFLLSFVLAV